MMIEIRPMRLSDVPSASRLITKCYKFLDECQGFSAVQLERILRDRCSEECVRKLFSKFEHYVAESDGTMVGFIGVEGNEIGELWVATDRHRQGIGSALFRKAEEIIVEGGHRVLTVHTTGYAIPFYQAMGAHVVEQKTCDSGPLEGWMLTFLEKSLQ